MSEIGEFHVIQSKPLAMQVCTTLSPDEACRRLESEHPCGTMNGWCYDKNQGQVPCIEKATTHKHMVFVA